MFAQTTLQPRLSRRSYENVSLSSGEHDGCFGPLSVALVCVTLVYCDQTVGWIKMPIGIKVGLVLAVLATLW